MSDQIAHRYRLMWSLAVFTLACAPVCPAQEADDQVADPVDSWYPRTVTSDNGSMIIHAPQIDAWEDFATLTAWVAFQITAAGSDDSYYGAVRFEAATDTDIAEREVLLHDFEILDLTIKGLDEASKEYQLASEGIGSLSRTVPLDLVLEYLPAEMPVADDGDLNREPPQIFVSTTPAVLLAVDVEPVFVPLGETGLQFVINTNWDVLRHGDDGPVFLCYEEAWLTADDIAGTWDWTEALPGSFASVPPDENWSNVRACLPGDTDPLRRPAITAPTVFYATTPAELLLMDGAPDWTAIGDSGPEYAANTTQELFRHDGQVFFLVSGRWFRADDLDGPWTMTTDLPDAFGEIPPEDSADPHPKSYVRASVPGTREAWEAALVASIPRKAEIVRGSESALDLDVKYAGEPVFAPIEMTDIELAMNTSYQVLRFEGVYYLCHNATWLTGFGPHGPWTFADSIPEAFASIPPSSPAYNTTFVKVEGSDAEAIEYAYDAGYEGMYVEDETVVYGTGYPNTAMTITLAYGLYDGWWGYPYYPYYPWPPTYGYGSWYDPSTGRYGEAVVGYGPYGAAGGAAVYNPATGVYARGQAMWDSDEFAGRGFAYNPNTDTSVARNRYVDFEDNEGWSQSVARRGDEWRYSQSEWQDGRMVTEFESSRGTEGVVVREREGDTIVSEGTITGENRSATFEGVIEDGQANVSFDGSEGGSGELDRQLDDGQISGSGTFTRDGKTIESDMTRNAEGVKREFETSEGGQGTSVRRGDENAFVFESGSGDMYAGRDGNVYQKTEDGWAPVENPGTQSNARSDADRSQRGASSDALRDVSAAGLETAGGDYRSFGGVGGASPQYPGVQAGGGVTMSQYDQHRNQLERDYRSRQNGFDRYANHRSAGARGSRGGMRRRR